MAAWATQPAAAVIDRLDPLVSGRFRFRRPLYPDTAAEVTAAVDDCSGGRAGIKTAVVSDAGTHVVATITARTG
jgi:acyl-CoA thioesterase FadM